MNWYKAKTGNDQGLIVEEQTGKNIAVSYEEKDAHLIAAAPELLEACKEAYRRIGEDLIDEIFPDGEIDKSYRIFHEKLGKIISKAEGKD
jgi:hypothetical protein